MRLRFLVVSMIVLALSAGTGYAQTFTGMIDGYWSYNGNTPVQNGQRFNQYRAFDLYDQAFSLNYGELAVEYKPNNVGIRVDVGFGDAAEQVHYNEVNIWRHVQQAYITGTSGKFTLDFGKWVTPFGAEVIETKDNLNYTRGFVFTFGVPFYHMGGRATYAASDKVSITGYVVNGWDNVKENPLHDDARQLYEVIGSITPLSRLTLTGDWVIGRDHQNPVGNFEGPEAEWEGVAGYGKIKVSEKLNFNGRYEWFDDRDGLRTGIVQELQSATATAQIIPVTDLSIWAEFRKDWSTKDVFLKTQAGVLSPVDSFTDHQNTFTFGVTWSFTKMVQ
jgi:Putative beta-barrel porin-2, OmpL-like. bbp2